MRRSVLHPGFWCVLVAFVLPVSVLRAGNPASASARKAAKAAAFAEEAANLYSQIDLQEVGLTKKAFEYALKGYYYLLDHHWLNKTGILSICDLSQSSRNKRLYIVDLEQKTVLVNTYVAHGRSSGGEFATTFSNNPSSHKTSLGFYITQGTYYGNNGLSLRIRGMDKGFNDRAGGRNVVVHGSEYVGPDFLQMNNFCGRSYGCPAVPADESGTIIDLIKEGTCLFIYHPTKKYLTRSKILNY
jgi:L,D-transpeptidase catalytic domain